MTTPTNTEITIEAPGDLVAAVPHLLGFHPVKSVIVLGLRGAGTLLGLALRVDLPPPPGRHRDLAEQLVVPLTQQSTKAVTLIVIGCVEDTCGPPHIDVLDTFTEVFAEAGIPVNHRIWAAATAEGAYWRCYDEEGCSGVVPDPATTPLAAATVLAGAVTYQRREDIADTLAPEDDEILVRRAELLQRASEDTEPSDEDLARSARLFAAVREAVQRAGEGELALTDHDVVTMVEALADNRVRDACLRFRNPERDDAAQRLWTALVRATPAPERAEPACLLALGAYLRGDGVLAGIALERAEAAHPGHVLAALLRSALLTGMPPEQLEELVTKASNGARTLLMRRLK